MKKSFLKYVAGAFLLLPITIGNVQAETAAVTKITGAGATFPYPIYAKWAEAYQKANGIELNYQSIGSGGGIKQIIAKTVDFGASDKPLTLKADDEKTDTLEKHNLLQFPAIIGGVVMIVNIKGVEKTINLTGEVVGRIYRGDIKNWNHDDIKALNKDIEFPDAAITVAHRSDGSGTTFVFTDYLSKVDKDGKWKAESAIEWPTGIGGKGNEAVANIVAQTSNSIGYIEYAYAKQNKIKYTTLTNKAGKVVSPEIKTFAAGAANAEWKEENGYNVSLTDQSGDDSWPMTAASFILLQKDGVHNKAVVDFFKWSFENGAKMSEELDYIHLPKELQEKLIKFLDANVK